MTQKTSSNARPTFMVLANARSGTTYLQSLLSSLPGVATDYEYGWKSYGATMELHRIISDGIPDVFSDIRSFFPDIECCGSKFVLPIHHYHSDTEVENIVASFQGDGVVIHLIRDQWDILKSALARGVYHDFNPEGVGLNTASKMYGGLKQLSITGYGHNNIHGVQVDLQLMQLVFYIKNIIRNDYILNLVSETRSGITIEYDDISSSYPYLQNLLDTPDNPTGFNNAVSNPIVNKLANIEDTKINHHEILYPLCKRLYHILLDGKKAKKSAQEIFDLQIDEIDNIANH